MDPIAPINRRTLLRRGLQVGGVVAGAALVAVALEDSRHHTVTSSTTTSTTSTSTTLGPATPSDWTALAASLTGALILPSDGAYAADALLYNEKFVDLHPQAIAYCASAEDVARCVDFATAHETGLAARSGGHSYGGYSSCPGLVIDVSRLSSIVVDERTNTATVGAGAKLIDVYNAVGSHDLLLASGSCPTVGIAGITLGGGIGVLGRRYGLTSDNLRSLRLVTSDAHVVTASAEDHADLLWASRGGGGGNFGVATSFTFALHPVPELTLFTLQYPWPAAAALLEAWQHWTLTTPDELWSNCQLLTQGTYGYLAQTSGVFCGTPSALAGLLAVLERAVGSAPTYRFVGAKAYIDAMAIEAGCAGLTIAACHLAGESPGGTLSRSAYSAKSSYVDQPMDSAHVAAIVDAVQHLHTSAPTVGGGLAFDAYGGAINRVAPDATAFVHRDKLACIQATYSWSSATPASEIDAGAQWLTWLGATVFDPRTGAYQNYIDPTLANWATAYYGTNLERLALVKKTYDPENHFAFAQSIAPAP